MGSTTNPYTIDDFKALPQGFELGGEGDNRQFFARVGMTVEDVNGYKSYYPEAVGYVYSSEVPVSYAHPFAILAKAVTIGRWAKLDALLNKS